MRIFRLLISTVSCPENEILWKLSNIKNHLSTPLNSDNLDLIIQCLLDRVVTCCFVWLVISCLWQQWWQKRRPRWQSGCQDDSQPCLHRPVCEHHYASQHPHCQCVICLSVFLGSITIESLTLWPPPSYLTYEWLTPLAQCSPPDDDHWSCTQHCTLVIPTQMHIGWGGSLQICSLALILFSITFWIKILIVETINLGTH